MAAGNIPTNASVRGTAAGIILTAAGVGETAAGKTPTAAGVRRTAASKISTAAGVFTPDTGGNLAEEAENEGFAENTAFFAKNRVPVKKSQFDRLGFKTPNEAYD